MYYLDASALVKRYFLEAGSGAVNRLMGGKERIATSLLTYAETLATLSRQRGMRGITNLEYKGMIRMFEADWKHFLVVALHDDMIPLIRRVVSKYRLRGADGVHLASALFLEQALPEKVVMVAADGELLKAAEKTKMDVIDPSREG